MPYSKQKNTILIVGAAGFLGVNLACALSAKYNVIAGLHKGDSAKLEHQKNKLHNLADINHFHVGDIEDGFLSAHQLRENNINVVIYAAGQCDVGQAAIECRESDMWERTNTMQINAWGPKKLAENCNTLSTNGQTIKFIYLSSIYAANASTHLTDVSSHTAEQHYAYSKRFGEHLLENSLPSLDITAIRLPRMFGPHQFTQARAACLLDDILSSKIPFVTKDQMSLMPVRSLGEKIIDILELPYIIGQYNMEILVSDSEINTSTYRLAQAYNHVLSLNVPFAPLYNHSCHSGNELALIEEVVKQRVKHYDEASTTEQNISPNCSM